MTEASETLIDRIIDLEWEMAGSAAAGAGRPAAAPEDQGAFRVLRWMTHVVLPDDLLARLLGHLEQAKAEGRNLVAEKFARMEGPIPSQDAPAVITRLVDMEEAWMQAVHLRYPLTFPDVEGPFRAHLTADLETLPADYLEALCAFQTSCRDAGRNLIEERYEKLFRRLGYESIKARENKALLDSRRCGSCCS
jgi:hypothetical protein